MVLFNSRLFVVLIRPAGVASVVEPLVPRFKVVQDGRVHSIAANDPEPHYRSYPWPDDGDERPHVRIYVKSATD